MRRFIARRGNPLCIYSDSGTNFVSAERILKKSLEAWNQNHIHDHLFQRGIEWHYNPPSASHMGGSWERLIRLIRRILSAIFQTQLTSDHVLSTVMAEAESILNSRPLIQSLLIQWMVSPSLLTICYFYVNPLLCRLVFSIKGTTRPGDAGLKLST